MSFFRCRPFFPLLTFIVLFLISSVALTCLREETENNIPPTEYWIFKKVLWKCQGEEVKIYSSSRSHIIYIYSFIWFLFIDFFFQYFLFPIIGIFRVKFVESLFYIIFSANILKRMFERWVNQRAYLNDYQMSSKNAQSVLNTKF